MNQSRYHRVSSGFQIAVIPAKAGIELDLLLQVQKAKWIPACAGMTSLLMSAPTQRTDA
jgi:hypothetical protein